jgi:hypothetical protein
MSDIFGESIEVVKSLGEIFRGPAGCYHESFPLFSTPVSRRSGCTNFGDPGQHLGEIISGQNINIASGAKIQGVASVPDSGSCMFLLSIGIGCLIQAKKRFLS